MADSIAHRFINHPPADAHVAEQLDTVTAHVLPVALFFDEALPGGREASLAMTHLEQASMWAKAAIARNQDRVRPPQGFLTGDPVVTPVGDGHVIGHQWLDDEKDWEYVVALDQVDVGEALKAMARLVAGELPEREVRRQLPRGATRYRADDLALVVPKEADHG